MKIRFLFLSSLLLSLSTFAQTHNDYVGAGHQTGISVTTSHSQSNSNNGFYTIDGFPIMEKAPLTDAGRFLSQATLGADYETIQKVAAMGYEPWIDEQFNLPKSEYLPLTQSIYQHFINAWANQFGLNNVKEDGENLPFGHFFSLAWWQNNMTATDLLRHKIALALSEILVVSYKSGNLEDSGFGISYFYDILYKNAFGNYREVLRQVTLAPAMGTYLSHYNNPKSDPSINRHPDENYAREVMQLFSIGLYELNQDGTQKLVNNQPIPTYNNTDIKEFAKIFTGLGAGERWVSILEDFSDEPPEWGMDFYESNPTKSMKIYEAWHEQGEKRLLNGQIVPTGQTGMQDIEAAMDNLFNHPNIGPFIGRRLIQNLVKSNPSPAYIGRVAAAFADNGEGQRGDMKAIIKAILLDPEARDCDYATKNDIGKLRAPLARYVHALRAFKVNSTSNTFWDDGYLTEMTLQQIPLRANSVFNFYLPDYQPNGAIAESNQFAPEFQIHNSTTSISYGNLLYTMLYEEESLYNLKPELEGVGVIEIDATKPIQLDFSAEDAMASNLNALLDRLDILLTNGNLSTNTRKIIFNALNQMDTEDVWDIRNTAVFLIMLSPDYAILK